MNRKETQNPTRDILSKLVDWKRREARATKKRSTQAATEAPATKPSSTSLRPEVVPDLSVGVRHHPRASQSARDRANERSAPFEDLGDASDDAKPDLSSSIGRRPRGGYARRANGDEALDAERRRHEQEALELEDEGDMTFSRTNARNTRKYSKRGALRSDDAFENSTNAEPTKVPSLGSIDPNSRADGNDGKQRNVLESSDDDSDSDEEIARERPGVHNKRIESDDGDVSRKPRRILGSTARPMHIPPSANLFAEHDERRSPISGTRVVQDPFDRALPFSFNNGQVRGLYNHRADKSKRSMTLLRKKSFSQQATSSDDNEKCTKTGKSRSLWNPNSPAVPNRSMKLREEPDSFFYRTKVSSDEENTVQHGRVSKQRENTKASQINALRADAELLESEVRSTLRSAAENSPSTSLASRNTRTSALRGAVQPSDVRDAAWWTRQVQLRKRLSLAYLLLLKIDSSSLSTSFSLNNTKMDIESRIWKFAFYDLIETFRHYLKTHSGADEDKVRLLFVGFLDVASAFYRDLAGVLGKFVVRASISKEKKPTETENSIMNGGRANTPKERTLGPPRWYKCLCIQGDLARYKAIYGNTRDDGNDENWEAARKTYRYGLALAPGNGKLYNQLAIMSGRQEMMRFYYYCRCQTVKHSFSSAREAIQSLFESNRQKLVKEAPKVLQPEQGKKKGLKAPNLDDGSFGEITWELYERLFIRLHGIMFSRIELDGIDQLLRPFLNTPIPSTHSTPDDPRATFSPRLFFYFQAAIANLTALHGYGPGTLHSSTNNDALKATSRKDPSADVSLGDKETVTHHSTLPSLPDDAIDGIQSTVAPTLTFGMLLAVMSSFSTVEISPETEDVTNGWIVYAEVLLTWMVGSGVLTGHGSDTPSEWERRYAFVEILSKTFWMSLAGFLNQVSSQLSAVSKSEISGSVSESSSRDEEVSESAKLSTASSPSSSPPFVTPIQPQDCALRGLAFMNNTHGDVGSFREFEIFMTGAERSAFPQDLTEMRDVSGELPRGDALWRLDDAHNGGQMSRSSRMFELGLLLTKLVKGFEYDGSFSAKMTLEITATRRSVQHEPISVALSRPCASLSGSSSKDGTPTDDEAEKDEAAISEDEDIRALKARRKELKDQLENQRSCRSSAKLADVKNKRRGRGTDGGGDRVAKDLEIVLGHTSLVIDTNCFVRDLFLIKKILGFRSLPVVVPLVVVTELHGLKSNQNALGEAAKEAIKFLENFLETGPKTLLANPTDPTIALRKTLRIITSKGNAVPGMGFREEFTLARSSDEDTSDDDCGLHRRRSMTEQAEDRDGSGGSDAESNINLHARRIDDETDNDVDIDAHLNDDVNSDHGREEHNTVQDLDAAATKTKKKKKKKKKKKGMEIFDDRNRSRLPDHPRSQAKNLDDLILETCATLPSSLLVTDDANLRLKAHTRSVAVTDGQSLVRVARRDGWWR